MSSTETDIRIRVGFFRHFKTRKLKRMLGAESVLCLQTLWAWAAENRTTGDLGGMADDDIVLSADWEGDTSVFISALVACGWLDKTERGYQLHDYEIEQPYIQKRALRIENGRKGAEKANENMTPEQRSERGKKGAAARWSDDECLEDAKYPLDKCLVDARYTGHGCLVKTKSMLAPSLSIPNPSCPDLPLPDQLLEQEGSEDIHNRKPAGLPTTKAKFKAEVQSLFDLWCQVMEHPNAKLGPKRQRRIEWALKNYGLERSQRAIIGCAASPFHMGDNKDGKRFDDLELIFRNEEKFEAFEIQGQKATVEVNSDTGATKVMVTKSGNDVRSMTIEQESAMYAAMLDKKRQQKPSGIVVENQYAQCQFPEYKET